MAHKNEATNEQAEKSKGRDYAAYYVRDGEEGSKSVWTAVGSAFLHKDGKGLNVVLDSGQRIVLRAPRKDQEKGA